MRVSLPNSRQRPERDGVTHYSYGEGFLSLFSSNRGTRPRLRGRGEVTCEGELAELSTQGRHQLEELYSYLVGGISQPYPNFITTFTLGEEMELCPNPSMS